MVVRLLPVLPQSRAGELLKVDKAEGGHGNRSVGSARCTALTKSFEKRPPRPLSSSLNGMAFQTRSAINK